MLIGRGVRRSLPTHLPLGTSRAVLVTDERMAVEADFTELKALLEQSDVTVRVISSVQPELPVDDAVAAAKWIEHEPDVIIAVGGGSVMDFAKVLAVLLTHGGIPEDYYGEFAVPGPTVPVIALPTTAGTGSEATPIAVVSDSNREMKVGISSPYLIPTVALCDPELTDSAPPSLTAVSGTDALSHCIESFTAVGREPTAMLPTERVFIGKSTLVDLYALAGVRAVGRSLRDAVVGDRDATRLRTARDDMMFAALAGGLALGTGGTAAAHALQYPVGALTHTPHGAGIGALLPYVMAFNRPARVPEFAEIALALGAHDSDDVESLSYQAIDAVRALLAQIGIPPTLAELGVSPGMHTWIAARAATARRLVENNPRELTVESLTAIAAAAHAGDMSILDDYLP
ncbi:iron-containing alcohol dehydrogenase [Nocardia sp. NPDC004711]